MTEYDNTDRGVLFKNTYKEDGDNKPDFKGTLNVGGRELELAAWKKTSNDGSKKFLSLKVSEPYVAAGAGSTSPTDDTDLDF